MAKQNADGHIYAIRIGFGFSDTMEFVCLPILYLYSTFQHKVIQSALQKMKNIKNMAFQISH